MKNHLIISLFLISISTLLFSSCSETNEDNQIVQGGEINVQVKNIDETTSKETSFILPDSGQDQCYGNDNEIECASEGEDYFGQDAQFGTNSMKYEDNGDGTITDLNTGLMWTDSIDFGITFDDANDTIDDIDVGGYDDWRIPTTTELYSLIDFEGTDPSGFDSSDEGGLIPFINTDYFNFVFGGGGGSLGNRVVDVQGITSTMYESTVMSNKQECFFGVNFADGRIKCYALGNEGQYFRILYVRGDSGYGDVDFTNNQDGTVIENNTELTWQQDDSIDSMQWKEAISYCSDLELGGRDDWRLPNTKELQYIVDYTRSPDTTSSASIYDIFNATVIENEAGEDDYGFYWTNTTHRSFEESNGNAGAYIAFGRSLGYDEEEWVDVHGAGSQRSDPKDATLDDYPTGDGPQGDAVRGYNMVRCVSGGDDTFNSYVEYTDDEYTEYYDYYDSSESESEETSESENMPPMEGGEGMGMQQGAPEEAITACSTLALDDTCSFSTPNGDISGICTEVEDSVIACFPSNMQK